MSKFLFSWGRYPKSPQQAHELNWENEVSLVLQDLQQGCLAYGLGRSYGDSCLAASNHVIKLVGMDRILSVDWSTGVICAQAGLSLADLIHISMPHGWFPAVTPGTKFVTLGGAVANDVHGKNHHVKGTFGCHVRKIRLLRSDEGIVDCSPSVRSELFNATIGGIGLTGVILSVEIQLRAINSSLINQRSIRFGGLEEFFDLAAHYDQNCEYTVAWIDCLAKNQSLGRGHFIVGDHAHIGTLQSNPDSKLVIPFELPFSLVNSLSLRLFNWLYYNRQQSKERVNITSYSPFFYPLDGVRHWNRMYGNSGFQQYQCVIPMSNARDVIRQVMKEISLSDTGSFLAVLKQCGEIVSPGLLSFPMHGISLALDFPQRAEINERLFSKLDHLVHDAGGRLYPAKDAHMSQKHFKQGYSNWQILESFRDPQLLSQFWKRVTR